MREAHLPREPQLEEGPPLEGFCIESLKGLEVFSDLRRLTIEGIGVSRIDLFGMRRLGVSYDGLANDEARDLSGAAVELFRAFSESPESVRNPALRSFLADRSARLAESGNGDGAER